MKLCYSPTSPYVRKVTMAAIETGTNEKIERVTMYPAGPASEVAKVNPLGKVPALMLDNGSALYDSPVICEYLDHLGGGSGLFPAAGPERWNILRLQALADGVMDAGILIMLENRRPESERSSDWIERQKRAMRQGFDGMEEGVDVLAGDGVTIAHITFCAALGWIDFRSIVDWRDGRPALADWYAAYSARPSAMATEPVAPES